MEIKIQVFNRVFTVCIGRHKKWFSQSHCINVFEEIYDKNYQVVDAHIIWGI